MQEGVRQRQADCQLQIAGVRKNFGGVVALDGVDLTLRAGSITCIIGPNGCGKTTLFNVISGAFRPTAGSVRYLGDDIAGIAPFILSRRGIARKFQVPGIYPSLSVAENLEAAFASKMTIAQRFGLARGEETTLRKLLDLCQLNEKSERPASELAHGEKQWLEIAMLLGCDPKLILLDEPTAGMTIAETQRTAELVMKINEDRGKTILVIEHDMSFVQRLACRVIVMMRGRVFREGTFDQVRADPEVRKAYLGEARP
jgi:ABC-type uncharacterized transport system ATPase subunit